MSPIFIFILITAIRPCRSACYPPCDTACQTCSGSTCVCQANCQSDGKSGCCPKSLTATSGICVGISSAAGCSMPGTFTSRTKCCTALGTGVNLAFFPDLASYQLACASFPSQLPDGAAVLAGVARINPNGTLNPAESFKTVADLQDPPPFVYWDPNPIADSSVQQTVGFLLKSGTTAPTWKTSDNTGPTWQGPFPLSGYIGICQYFPQYPNYTTTYVNTTTVTTNKPLSTKTTTTRTVQRGDENKWTAPVVVVGSGLFLAAVGCFIYYCYKKNTAKYPK